MKYIVALVYAIVALIMTQNYFSRIGSSTTGFLVSLVFAWAAFVIVRATLIDWASAMVAPIDHVSVHARIVINLLAPLLATTILARILYVVTGMSPLMASLLLAVPWWWMTDWVHGFLFPPNDDTPPRRLLRCFVPLQLFERFGG